MPVTPTAPILTTLSAGPVVFGEVKMAAQSPAPARAAIDVPILAAVSPA